MWGSLLKLYFPSISNIRIILLSFDKSICTVFINCPIKANKKSTNNNFLILIVSGILKRLKEN